MWKRHHVKYLLFLSDFNETWIFSTDFRKKLKYKVSSHSMQSEPSCSVRMDGQTDLMKMSFFAILRTRLKQYSFHGECVKSSEHLNCLLIWVSVMIMSAVLQDAGEVKYLRWYWCCRCQSVAAQESDRLLRTCRWCWGQAEGAGLRRAACRSRYWNSRCLWADELCGVF